MNKLFVILAVLLILAGCAAGDTSKNETTIYSLIEEYRNFPNGGIVEADMKTILSLSNEIRNSKFRICGIASEVKRDTYFDVGDLVLGDMEIRAYFEKSEGVKDGEYIEVVGFLRVDQYMVVIDDCVVTERGASVRERIEQG